MSEPSTPRNTLVVNSAHNTKRQSSCNSNFSVTKSEDPTDEVDKSRKFFTTWRTACDKTKDKTRNLLKRTLSWRGSNNLILKESGRDDSDQKNDQPGWSVHIWTTWVTRSSMNEEKPIKAPMNLSPIQKEKFAHLFHHLLDTNHDDLITPDDFERMRERFRHFADLSPSSTEYSFLQQVMQEFVRTFFSFNKLCSPINDYIEIDDWLCTWSTLICGIQRLNELPFWLQQLPKVLFLVINKSGCGLVKKSELRNFFISVVGVHDMNDDELTEMYKSWTANGDFRLNYSIYELCFANWMLCQNPNGPGQWLFGKCGPRPEFFPIDYSAMNSSPKDIEPYNPNNRSNRYSIVV